MVACIITISRVYFMRNKFRRLNFALAAGFLYASVFGCLSACKPAATTASIRFGYIAADQLHSPAVMIMKERKLLEAAGFSVEWKEYLTGAYVMQDVASDAVDYAACGAVPIMVAHANNDKMAIIAGANREGSSLVVKPSIAELGDLDGGIIGIPGHGTIQDAMAARIMKENSIYFKRVTVDVSEMPNILENGDIDGFIAWAPYPANAVLNGVGRELLTSRDMMPDHQCCVLVTKESTLKDNRKTAKKLLEIYLDAMGWFLGHPEESRKLLAKYTGLDEAVISLAGDTVNYVYPPYCNADSMLTMAEGLVETGRISIDESDLATFVDSLYHPELLDEIIKGSE